MSPDPQPRPAGEAVGEPEPRTVQELISNLQRRRAYEEQPGIRGELSAVGAFSECIAKLSDLAAAQAESPLPRAEVELRETVARLGTVDHDDYPSSDFIDRSHVLDAIDAALRAVPGVAVARQVDARESLIVTCHCGSPMIKVIEGETDDLYVCEADGCPQQVNLDFRALLTDEASAGKERT